LNGFAVYISFERQGPCLRLTGYFEYSEDGVNSIQAPSPNGIGFALSFTLLPRTNQSEHGRFACTKEGFNGVRYFRIRNRGSVQADRNIFEGPDW
jgi:hypothetical protein